MLRKSIPPLLLLTVALAGCASDPAPDEPGAAMDKEGDAMDGEDAMAKTENQEASFDGDCVSSVDSTSTGYAGLVITVETGTIACEDVAGAGANEVSISGCADASTASVILGSDDFDAGSVTLRVAAGGAQIFEKVYDAETFQDGANDFLAVHSGYTLSAERSSDFESGFAAVVQCTH